MQPSDEESTMDENLWKSTPKDQPKKASSAVKSSDSKAPIKNVRDMLYCVEDVPPFHLSFLLGFQHYLMALGSIVATPYLLAPAMCIPDDHPARGHMISTIIFVSGIVTLLQATFGIRLPIIQGGTTAFLIPTFAILSLPKWQCRSIGFNSSSLINHTSIDDMAYDNDLDVDDDEYWQLRMREVQGAIIVGALFEFLIGFSGLIGHLLRFISPLAIVPTVSLIGLGLFQEGANMASGHWGISCLTIVLIIIFSQYLSSIGVPGCSYTRSKGCHIIRFPLFKLFPVLLSITIVWGLCVILTTFDVFPHDTPVRTDRTMRPLQESPWFRIPYPGQWGAPTFSVAAVLGMLAGVISSVIESVGDYYACARLSGAPSPPVHAVNRGISIEGLGCLLAGLWGTGNGTTSYSQNVGAIGVTKVGSRRVAQMCGVLMLFLGLLSKFGALFVTIPSPIIGGVFCVMFSMVAAVGLSNLQYVNLESPRNLFILGCSLFFGLAIPKWMIAHKHVPLTGFNTFDQVLTVLLRTSMFVGGFIGIFLDNTIPGTREERGLDKWQEQFNSNCVDDDQTGCYDLPIGMSYLQSSTVARHLPISPTYKPVQWCCSRLRKAWVSEEELKKYPDSGIPLETYKRNSLNFNL